MCEWQCYAISRNRPTQIGGPPISGTASAQIQNIRASLPLLSVPVFTDNGLDVRFTKTKVTVTDAAGNTVLEGVRDPINNLYLAPIVDPEPTY